MGYKFNPTTGGLDVVSDPGGSDTQIQFNDAGSFGGDVDLTWNKTTNVMTLKGDLTLDDNVAGSVTTLQTITPTQNNTISLPNATGTVALVAGSSGQLIYNNAGAYTGVPGATVGSSGNITLNAASGFTGNLLDLQVNGTSSLKVSSAGSVTVPTAQTYVFGPPHVTLQGLQSSGYNTFTVNLANSQGAFQVRGDGRAEVNGLALGFSPLGAGTDLFLHRDAAGILAQRNSANAQTFRVYNTYTSSTNYELGKLEWSSNTFRIGTEKGSGGGTARNLELQTDGTTRVTIGATSGHLTGSNDVYCGSSAFIGCNLRSILSSPADGVMRISNYAVNDFDRLQFGGTTTSFPALKRSSATLQARLADDSGYTTIDAQHRLQGTAPATSTSTGTAGDIRYDADYIYVCTATNTWKRAALTTW